MTQTKVASKSYYPALTGIRAIAAYLVFFHHFNPFIYNKDESAFTATHLLGGMLQQWHIGVAIFFVLSGFLIGTRYMDHITLSPSWAKQYILNRFARIYPLYFILTIIAFTSMLIWPSYAWYEWQPTSTTLDKVASLVLNFTLTRAFFNYFHLIGIPPAWSLTVEECFYLSAPFILLAVRRRAGLLPVFGLILLSIGIVVTLIASYLHVYGSFMQPVSFMLNHTYFGRCTEFLLGIGLALWLRKKGSVEAPRGTTLAGIVFIAAVLAGMVATNWNYERTEAWPTSLNAILLNNFVLPIGVVVLFFGLINEQTYFRQLLETKLFDLLGKSSYAFYLIHFGLFSDRLQQVIGGNIILLFIVFNVTAILLYKLVEHPLHSAVIRRYRNVPKPKAPANIVSA